MTRRGQRVFLANFDEMLVVQVRVLISEPKRIDKQCELGTAAINPNYFKQQQSPCYLIPKTLSDS